MSDNETITTTTTITGSFYGIMGEFLKRLLLLLIYTIVFFTTNGYKKSFFSNNEITSVTDFLSKKIMKFDFVNILPLILITLMFIVLAILVFLSLLKTIKLFYNINRKITVDFSQGKIVIVSYSFPFFKNIEKDKFDTIITVNMEQGFMDRLFNSGKLYVEYLVSSKVDSSSVSFEIPYVSMPAKSLEELLSEHPLDTIVKTL